MYKDRLYTGADSVYPEVKKAGVIPLNDIPVDDQKDQEAVAPAVDPQTPVGELRRSSRTIKPPQRYYPALHYILLIDKGEP